MTQSLLEDSEEQVFSEEFGGMIKKHADKNFTYSVMAFRWLKLGEKVMICLQCGENDHFKYPHKETNKGGCPHSYKEVLEYNLGQASETDVSNGFDFNKRNDYIHKYKLAQIKKKEAAGYQYQNVGAGKRAQEEYDTSGQPQRKSPRTTAVPANILSRLSNKVNDQGRSLSSVQMNPNEPRQTLRKN